MISKRAKQRQAAIDKAWHEAMMAQGFRALDHNRRPMFISWDALHIAMVNDIACMAPDGTWAPDSVAMRAEWFRLIRQCK